jgi:hypothetical protein
LCSQECLARDGGADDGDGHMREADGESDGQLAEADVVAASPIKGGMFLPGSARSERRSRALRDERVGGFTPATMKETL